MIAIYGIELANGWARSDLEASLSPRLANAWRAHHKYSDARALPSLAALLLLQYATERGTLCYSENGKPFFADSAQTFSITHTEHFALCAVTTAHTGELGIDAEELPRLAQLPKERLAKRWLSDAERELLTQPSADTFARIWTRKEALVKLTGEGLAGLAREDSVTAPERLGVFFSEYRIGDMLVSLCAEDGLTAPSEICMLSADTLLNKYK